MDTVKKVKRKKPVSSKEKLSEFKDFLIQNLDYKEEDFNLDFDPEVLLIRSFLIVAWNPTQKIYCLSISVNTEPFGLACLLSFLYKNGMSNMVVIQKFYLKESQDDKQITYFDDDALREYRRDFRKDVKQEIMEDMLQTSILANAECKTLH